MIKQMKRSKPLAPIVDLQKENELTNRGNIQLKPVFLDGIDVGESYANINNRFFHYKRYFIYNRYFDKWIANSQCEVFPTISLVKVLFHFISRGHKSRAFLPVTFQVCMQNGTSEIDDSNTLSRLVSLGLLEFLPDDEYHTQLRTLAEDNCGILVSFSYSVQASEDQDRIAVSTFSPYHRRTVKKKRLISRLSCNTSTSAGSSSRKFENSKWAHFNLEKREPGQFIDYVTVVCSLFVGIDEKRYFLFPAEVSHDLGLYVSGEETEAYDLLSRLWQLTLEEQIHFLENLETLLNGSYPCGVRESKIVPLLKRVVMHQSKFNL